MNTLDLRKNSKEGEDGAGKGHAKMNHEKY